jgi:hypothetical protein
VLTPLSMHLVSVLPPSMLASRLAWDLFPCESDEDKVHLLMVIDNELIFWSDTWLLLYLAVVLPFC